MDKVNEEKEVEGETVVNSVAEEEKERRKKREATDANGNRVLQVYRSLMKTSNTNANTYTNSFLNSFESGE